MYKPVCLNHAPCLWSGADIPWLYTLTDLAESVLKDICIILHQTAILKSDCFHTVTCAYKNTKSRPLEKSRDFVIAKALEDALIGAIHLEVIPARTVELPVITSIIFSGFGFANRFTSEQTTENTTDATDSSANNGSISTKF